MSWQDDTELEYRYCLTLAVHTADHACREVVVFGESLNPVFGAPAAHLQRLEREESGGDIANDSLNIFSSFFVQNSHKESHVARWS